MTGRRSRLGVAVLCRRPTVLFNNFSIPATGDDWFHPLDLDFVPPGIAEVEQVLELLPDPEAECVQARSRGVEPPLGPKRIGLFEHERRRIFPGVGPAADRRRGAFGK